MKTSQYHMPEDAHHAGLLRKFLSLSGKILTGRDEVKGLAPDELVSTRHNLHDQIRGLYKPKDWNYVLSYLATEKDDNYGEQIAWDDKPAGKFREIILSPPSGLNDMRAKSDIATLRHNLEDKIPIGIIENVEKGKNRILGLGVLQEERPDGKFIVVPADGIFGGKVTMRNYFSYKTSVEDFVKDFEKQPSKAREFGGIYLFEDTTKAKDVVFLVFGGDRPKWDKGLVAICEVSKGPFGKGYDTNKKKNYKVELEPKILINPPITKKELIDFKDCFDIQFIGPMTKVPPTQANALLPLQEVKNLVAAIATLRPLLENDLKQFFGSDFESSIKSAVKGIDRKYILDAGLPQNTITDPLPRNRIFYGAPGTGKSYSLQKEVEKYFPDDALRTRVTFYPNYSYHNFIGAFRPSPLYKKADGQIFSADRVTPSAHQQEPVIDYAVAPGPLLETLMKAVLNPNHNFVLVIEELNRANAASVFGDTFQLLDRRRHGSFIGRSQYEIRFPNEIRDFLVGHGVESETVRFPRNLYLWATMNNADQGVQPLDAAFKRRWSFKYVGISEFESAVDAWTINLKFVGKEIKWNHFRRVVNEKLIKLQIKEDKLLGPFFLSQDELADENEIKHKLLLYLKEDVMRYGSGLFKKSTFSEILSDYDAGNEIFTIDKSDFENE